MIVVELIFEWVLQLVVMEKLLEEVPEIGI